MVKHKKISKDELKGKVKELIKEIINESLVSILLYFASALAFWLIGAVFSAPVVLALEFFNIDASLKLYLVGSFSCMVGIFLGIELYKQYIYGRRSW